MVAISNLTSAVSFLTQLIFSVAVALKVYLLPLELKDSTDLC